MDERPNGLRSSRDATLQQQVAQMSTRNPRAPARNIGRLLTSRQVGTTSVSYQPFTTIFAQGDPCAVVMYIEKGRVKLTVTSQAGRQAVVGILGAGAFFGEGALAGQRRRTTTAETMTASRIMMVKTAEMRRRLHEESALSYWFRWHLLTRHNWIEAALADRIFDRCEMRLARILLLLAHADEREATHYALPTISRDVLAKTIGSTRWKVDSLMNKFRKLGFLERHGERNNGVQVHRSLLNVVLRD